LLLLYRTLLIGFIIAVAISYSQGAKARAENGFLWSFAGIAIFVFGLVILGATINLLTPGTSAIGSVATTLAVTCVPFLAALYARAKLLPGSPLFSLPRSIPVVPVTVVTIGLTLFLIANELDGSLLAGIVTGVAEPLDGGRASQLEFMGVLANTKGTIVVSAIVGWLVIVTHLVLRAWSKRSRQKS